MFVKIVVIIHQKKNVQYVVVKHNIPHAFYIVLNSATL